MGKENDDNIAQHWRRSWREVAAEAAATRLRFDDEAHELMVREANPDAGKIYPIPKWFTGKRVLGNTQPIRRRGVYQVVLMSDQERLAIKYVGPNSRVR